MANRGKTVVKIGDLGEAIEQTLTLYHEDVNEALNAAAEKAVKDLAKKTKATAPVGARGSYRKNIASKLLKRTRNSSTYVWYVKAPDHRLTHLLVKGHVTKNGGRTRANPFLKNAVDQVIPAYERDIKEALKNDK